MIQVLRIITILLLIINRLYWEFEAWRTNNQKPADKTPLTAWNLVVKLIHPVFEILIPLQLFGLNILPINYDSQLIPYLGFTLVLIGITVGVLGRYEIGNNWSPDRTYQVKRDQSLVTSGIYKYIRHPIYVGRIIAFTGAELVAQSYLFVFVFIVYLIFFIIQAGKEEDLLLKNFGNEYAIYMKRSKRFIPYLY